ncbi:aspartic peptidase domain-containing protein [Chaetomium strumarium]|uniref:Aspartic peptidase domain-containing protein n=1 Tax=Chaetomium strumarium TaxID=1170767 RepID=A0AAJ0GPC2_9PEZI|nr:aspartic peptidase domain-containing protein [Chaetomium strumarium]
MLPLVFAATLVASAAAAEPRPAVARGNGIIRSPINAISGPAPKLRVRQNEVQVENQSEGTRYGVEIEVGTPPQKVTLILDTGSPDTWVNPSCATANVPADCRAFAQFDYTKSTSLNETGVEDILVYGIGNATIQYVYETVTIGSATIENQIIGIATESHSIPLGILGVSPPVQGQNEYPYVLDTMAEQGLINSRAFSLDLRGVDNPNGAIIFGGIDTGKYIGELAKLPMLAPEESPGGASRYYVTMTGVGVTLPDGEVTRSEEINVAVFLDSGSTLTHLPTPIYQAFAEAFGDAQYDPSSGFYFVPCDVTKLAGSIDFYFGTKVIRVPLNDFIWQVEGYCMLGVLPNDDEPILGDTFLRAAYVVFDQDNRNLHIAQAANCDTDLVAIGSGADAVPSSTGKCTDLPTPTGAGGVQSLDVTATRAPTNTFTGTAPTGVAQGPGPKVSNTRNVSPTETDKNAAGRGVEVRLGAVMVFGVVNMLAWML